MNAEETKEFIVKKFNVDINAPGPFPIWCSRFTEIPILFGELGLERGAEIGVYRGRYSNDLLTRCPTLKHLLGVDLWEFYKGYKEFDKILDIQDAHKEAIETYTKHGDRATMVQGYSREVAKTIPDESLDFVFIDANHAFEFVVEDIAAWEPKVRKGGIVYGHDYDDYQSDRYKWKFMQVVEAVDGWVKAKKIHPLFVLRGNKNKCWMWVKE